ncbi:cysteine--tRNA ligase [Psittacicella gerlachiana]|uniref:Cysteine--tRNA ligase n=1 Tax=Psittacicella gerlachiana TaxID=2028574 RepID=A0A3A1Y914_9GAMM|nr:cysteine--tRNA ligase [Psittacicella gerlachiana]RIY33816.1 cysteine--tRNA ligase [Psittacicella gerlachiana]
MSELKLYNSYSRSKETFKPIEAGQIKMYVCGATVYDYIHAGNGRTFVAFDTINRYLRFAGYKVTFVRNITDIDDKIINRANANNETFNSLTERMITEMYKDLDGLNVLHPDVEPRASQVIPEIIKMCMELQAKGYAYQNSDGDLLFKVDEFKDYGKLSRQVLDQLQTGTRTEISQNKHSSLDFVLWKQAKPGEPMWDSPWGQGRPGWHIECSAMSNKYLGSHFDIHAGGNDLMFPHHENEIAQSCCATGDKFANYWLHSGMVMVDKEKMSKSLNNFFTVRTLLENYEPEAVRFFLAGAHYRSDLNYTTENLEIATKSLERIYTALKGNSDVPFDKVYTASEIKAEFGAQVYVDKFTTSMNDDFNAPEAIAVLFELVTAINTAQDRQLQVSLAQALRALGNVFGILFKSTDDFFQNTANLEVDSAYIEELIAKRAQARASKDWATADAVRDELNRLNIVVEDGVNGYTWKVKK